MRDTQNTERASVGDGTVRGPVTNPVIGFACIWDARPRSTWSYTPWNLREALHDHAEVADLGIHLPTAARRMLQLQALRRSSHGWVTPWKHSAVWERGSEAYLRRRSADSGCDAVIQIQDLARTDVPYFLYQDLSYDLVLRQIAEGSDSVGRYFPHLDRDEVARLRERQLRIYEGAAGLLTMSEFLRRSLVEDTGIHPSKVHTVYPGAVRFAPSEDPPPVERATPRTRLLFVGTSFEVKGGDLVVRALSRIRAEDPRVTLTVAGPDRWPLADGVPDGVEFLGRMPAREVAQLYQRHDLLVMPSRTRGFRQGVHRGPRRRPPLCRTNAFAMPELIRPGENGALVDDDSPEGLAQVVLDLLADDQVFESCARDRRKVLGKFNWDRCAADMVSVIERTLTG